MAAMKKRWGWIMAGGWALLLGGCGGESAPAPAAGGAPPPAPVKVQVAEPVALPAMVEVVGRTEGSREVEVRPHVGGILLERVYQEGAAVKQGEKLFRIDPVPFEIALAYARASLAEQKAKLDLAEREEVRQKELLSRDSASRRQYDTAVANAAVAKASLQAAEARVREAELNLSYATVTAPVAGLTGRAARFEGALIPQNADNLLTTIVQTDPIRVRFSLAESEIARLPEGRLTPDAIRKVELLLPDGAPYGSAGRVDFVAHRVDAQLGTVEVRAEFPNPEGRLLPGRFARVRLFAGEREGCVLLPQSAVLQSDKGRFVYVLDADNKAQVRVVNSGPWSGQEWVILEGLKAGDKVVVDNLLKVRPGAVVAPLPADGKEAAPAAKAG